MMSAGDDVKAQDRVASSGKREHSSQLDSRSVERWHRRRQPWRASHLFEFAVLVTRRHDREHVVNTTLENPFCRECTDQPGRLD